MFFGYAEETVEVGHFKSRAFGEGYSFDVDHEAVASDFRDADVGSKVRDPDVVFIELVVGLWFRENVVADGGSSDYNG